MPPPIDWQVEYYDSVANQPAQSEYPNIPHILDSLYQRLDPSKIPSGRLLDRTVQYVYTQRYNGVVADSNDVAFGDVFTLYLGLQASSVDTVNLMPFSFDTNWVRAYLPTDTIPFVMMGAQYDYIKEHAVDSGLIGFDTLENIFSDISPESSESAYGQDYVFAAA